jgi:LuxR family maltose regulon positive regulatory protein
MFGAIAMRSGAERMLEDAQLAVDALDGSDPWHVAATATLGVAQLVTGRDTEADVTLRQALDEAAARKSAQTAAALAAVHLAHLAMIRNDWGMVEQLVHTSRDLIARNHLGEQSPALAVDAVAARLAVHRGQRDSARALLAHAQRIRPVVNHAIPWLAVRARLDLATAHLGLADPAGARTLAQEIRDVISRRRDVGRLADEFATLQSHLQKIRDGAPGASTLTIAELRLLPLLSTHLTFREIADRLFVSPHTVKTQAISIYRKLDATSRSEAITRAVQVGLIDDALRASVPGAPAA